MKIRKELLEKKCPRKSWINAEGCKDKNFAVWAESQGLDDEDIAYCYDDRGFVSVGLELDRIRMTQGKEPRYCSPSIGGYLGFEEKKWVNKMKKKHNIE